MLDQRILLPALLVMLTVSACAKDDPHSQSRNEHERVYLESRLEAFRGELEKDFFAIPGEKILSIVTPELKARMREELISEIRAELKAEIRAEVIGELVGFCEVKCQDLATGQALVALENSMHNMVSEQKAQLEAEMVQEALEPQPTPVTHLPRQVAPPPLNPITDATVSVRLKTSVPEKAMPQENAQDSHELKDRDNLVP